VWAGAAGAPAFSGAAGLHGWDQRVVEEPAAYVDPFLGTLGAGFVFPGPAARTLLERTRNGAGFRRDQSPNGAGGGSSAAANTTAISSSRGRTRVSFVR
jgi:hypothetical protein